MSEPDLNVRRIRLESGQVIYLRAGDGSPEATAAVQDVLQPPGASLLAPWRQPGGPGDIRAAYELLRRQVNGLTRVIDGLLIGAHAQSYGGNIRLLNRGRGRSILGQHLVDPIVDERRPSSPALRFLHSVRGRRRDVALNRASFVFERVLSGDVSDDGRPFLQLAERLGDGATATGAWLEDALRTFSIQHDGTFYTQGGLFLFGSSAHAILRGGSAFLEGGGNLVLMGQGVTSDDATGYACALAAGAPGQLFIGDLYSSIDVSAFLYGDLNLIHAIDGLPSKLTAGYLVLRELSAAQVTALGAPSDGLAYFYVSDVDELPYFKGRDGVAHPLTGGSGVTDHGALTGLTDDDHTIYLLAGGSRPLTADWDAGSFKVRAQTLESDVATGTAPLIVASTTKVANLNVDRLDDQEGAYYLDLANATGTLALARHGTQVANRVLAGPTTGADAAPTFRALVAADLPGAGGTVALSSQGQTSGFSLAYTVPAGTLAAAGDLLDIEVGGRTGASSETVRLRLGAQTVFSATVITSRDWILRARIRRLTNTTQISMCSLVAIGEEEGQLNLAMTVDLATALDVTADYATANAAGRGVHLLVVEKTSAP